MQTSEQCIIFCQNHSLGILLVVLYRKTDMNRKAGHTLETLDRKVLHLSLATSHVWVNVTLGD